MGTESGKDGNVIYASVPLPEITGWEINVEAHSFRYASNSTNKHKKTLPGTIHGSGSLEFKWTDEDPWPLPEGTVAASLELWTDDGDHHLFPATIKNFRLKVNIDTGDITAVVADFETDGVFVWFD